VKRLDRLRIEMARETKTTKSGGTRTTLPAGVMMKPPVSLEELRTGIENDPKGAEEFAALIRTLRREAPRTIGV
jgi:hypothetical protein